MRRELFTLSREYRYQIISRRPVKRPTYNTEGSPLRQLFEHQHIAQKITEHLNLPEINTLAEFFPEFSAHNTFKIANRVKNQKPTSPPFDITDVAIGLNASMNWITNKDAITMFERKASATRAGYVYNDRQVAISVSRIRSREINNMTEPDTTLLWR